MMRRTTHFSTNERGIYLVLTALLSMVLLSAFVILALENLIAYHVAYDLRTALDEACSATLDIQSDTRRAPGVFQSDTINIFSKRIAAISIKNTVKIGGQLTMAFMPSIEGGPQFTPIFNTIGCGLDGDDPPSPLSCELNWNVAAATSDSFPFRPGTFIPSDGNRIFTAGSTIGCSLTVRLNNKLSSFLNLFRPTATPRTVKAYSAYDIPVRSAYADPDTTIDFPGWNVKSPGLTIAIAPMMSTSAKGDQYRFGNYSNTGAYEPLLGKEVVDGPDVEVFIKGQHGGIDPLRNPGAAGGALNRKAFSRLNVPGVGQMAPYNENGSVAGGPNNDGFVSRVRPLYPYSKSVNVNMGYDVNDFNAWAAADNYPFVRVAGDFVAHLTDPGAIETNSFYRYAIPPIQEASGIYSDQEEMLVACMNPAILLRNVFAASIVELASRHGGLRFNSEILYVNPLGYGPRALDSVYQGANTPPAGTFRYGRSPIVEMVSMGDDLAAQSNDYELPFVWFEAGDRYQEKTAGGDRILRFKPFGTGGGMAMNHYLVANQLRFCHHLYYNPPGITPATYPYDAVTETYGAKVEETDLSNTGLFRAQLTNLMPKYAAQRIRNVPNVYEPNNPYDNFRHNIWKGAAKPRFWSPAPLDGLNAATILPGDIPPLTPSELVSMIGSVQSCPIEQRGLVNPLTPAADGPPAFPLVEEHNTAIPPGQSSPTCVKPDPSNPNAKMPSELRPDYVALLNYLSGTKGVTAEGMPKEQYELLVPAGNNNFFKAGVPKQGHASYTDISDGALYGGAGLIDRLARFPGGPGAINNFSNALLIITHRPPNDLNEEIGRIRDAVNRFQRIPEMDPNLTRMFYRYHRPITVVYIPTNVADASSAAVDRLAEAFVAPLTDDPRPTGNVVVVLDPNLSAYSTNPAGSYGPSRTPDSKNHRLFYAAMLTDDTQGTFKGVEGAEAAKKIFYQLLLKPPQAKF